MRILGQLNGVHNSCGVFYVSDFRMAFICLGMLLCAILLRPAISLTYTRRHAALTKVSVPHHIQGEVTDLDLKSNVITRLENGDLRNLTELINIYLTYNKIAFIGKNAFLYTSKLERIGIGWNELQTYPSVSFLPRLISVQLYHNAIQWLPESHMEGLPRIDSLLVGKNRLSRIPNLSHLSSLKYLKIYENNLTTIPDCYELPLIEVDMAYNPWLCDVELCWIRMWPFKKPALKLEIHSGAVANCAAPANLSGTALMEVHPVDMGCYKGKHFLLYLFILVCASNINKWKHRSQYIYLNV